MPQTTNKGYEIPTTGTEENTWGDTLNTLSFTVIDKNVGGSVGKTLGASQVDLSASESQNLIVRLTGTLTADVLVTTLANGVQIVENATSGSFAVTFQRNGVGSPVTVAQGTRAVVILDGTNGARSAASTLTEFSAGVRMVFNQTSAPTAWTKESSATYNDAALRFVTGTPGTGGTLAFSSAFASRSLTGTVTGTALSEAQLPSHTHFTLANESGSGESSGSVSSSQQVKQAQSYGVSNNNYSLNGTATVATVGKSSSTGSGQTHNHGLTINNLDIAVKRVDCIIAQKS